MSDAAPAISQREASSFRDPSGYVFKRDDRVFRAVDSECAEIIRDVIHSGLLSRLIEDGLVIGTCFVDDPELLRTLKAEHPGFYQFLEHDSIAPISFAYEWPISALASAAIHTLDLQLRLLEEGYSLKDATAYNIQFVNGSPVFIDIASIERPKRLDVWRALGQFGQMFTYPLLLSRYHGWDLRSYFLGTIGGRDLEQVSGSIGKFKRWHPRYLLDVTVPCLFHGKQPSARGVGANLLEKENRNAAPQIWNLKRLRRKIEKLAKTYKPRSGWADYATACSYSDESENAKKSLVRTYLELVQPASVLDVGCNTGDYSCIAAQCGAKVVSADSDHDAVELLYRRSKNHPTEILPLVLDLCNPSPAIGYLNRERDRFFDRVDVDCVLALALVHHLHVSGNLPLSMIRDLFYEVTKSDLVLEFVPADDVMFRRLTTFRPDDLYRDYTLDACRAVFGERFEIVREDKIVGSPRTLLLLRKLYN